MAERALRWDGCVNVRDLGGLPIAGGAQTRFRKVVRADDAAGLSPAGRQALRDYGVSRIVDLRHEDPPYESPVEIVRLPLYDADAFRDVDELLAGEADAVEYRVRGYLFFLQRYSQRFARAVAAVAEPTFGTVVIHCAGGVDRTGLVSALLLRLAGVRVDAIADDYAESEPCWAPLVGEWIEGAPDEAERRKRRMLSVMPAVAMQATLAQLERRHRTVAGYLCEAGLSGDELELARACLRG